VTIATVTATVAASIIATSIAIIAATIIAATISIIATSIAIIAATISIIAASIIVTSIAIIAATIIAATISIIATSIAIIAATISIIAASIMRHKDDVGHRHVDCEWLAILKREWNDNIARERRVCIAIACIDELGLCHVDEYLVQLVWHKHRRERRHSCAVSRARLDHRRVDETERNGDACQLNRRCALATTPNEDKYQRITAHYDAIVVDTASRRAVQRTTHADAI